MNNNLEYIISSDNESNDIIKSFFRKDLSEKWKMLLEIWAILWKEYSFVNNQTYPRPSHPFENQRTDIIYTISAIIISLRTTLENERIATNNMIEKYPTIEELKLAEVNDLAEAIKVAWMQNNKAFKIKEILKKNIDFESLKKHNKNLIVDTLKKLPWVWQKSTDCILLLWMNIPSFVVDTNVFRLIKRLFDMDPVNMNYASEKQILEVKNILESNIINDTKLYQILHTLYLMHWKNICKSIPKCQDCKLKMYCRHYKNLNQ